MPQAQSSLRSRLLGWPDALAVEWTARLGSVVLDLELGDLSHLRRLDTLGQRLAEALATEAELERQHQQTALAAVEAQSPLRASVVPRMEDAAVAVVRAEVCLHFRAWADPYAADTTGQQGLATMRAVVEAAPLGVHAALADVDRALATMREAGLRHDHTDDRLRQAIAQRVAAREAWNQAVVGLLAALDAHAAHQLLQTLPAEQDPGFDESGWFDETPSA